MIFKLLSLIDKKQKKILLIISLLIIISSIIELLSLGAVIPVLHTLMEPNLKEIKNDIIKFIPSTFNIKIFVSQLISSLNKIEILYLVLSGLVMIYF